MLFNGVVRRSALIISRRQLVSVVIVGRPNVGKSTLFNALRDVRGARENYDAFEKEKAVESTEALELLGPVKKVDLRPRKFRGAAARPQLTGPIARTTRDARRSAGRLGDLRFEICDTAGYEVDDTEYGPVKIDDPYGRNWTGMTAEMLERTKATVKNADAILHVLDAREGLTGLDTEVAEFLRKETRAPRLVVFNKCELERMPKDSDIAEAKKFVGRHDLAREPIYVSAQHGDGMSDILEALRRVHLKKEEILDPRVPRSFDSSYVDDRDNDSVRMAFVGKPNVGKSSLLNSLAGETIALSSRMPGATRDPVEFVMDVGGRNVTLVDTAGVRGASKRSLGMVATGTRTAVSVEAAAKRAAARQLTRDADVVCLLVDASVGRIQADDLRLARKCVQEASGPVIVVATKVDLLGPGHDVVALEKAVAEHLENTVKSIDPPVIAVSTQCETFSTRRRRRLAPQRVLQFALEVYDNFANTHIPTRKLNDWLRDWVATPLGKPDVTKMRNIKFIAQTATRPPTFTLHGRGLSKILNASCLDGLRRAIVNDFGFKGSRIQFRFKDQVPLKKKSAIGSPFDPHKDFKNTPRANKERRRVVGPIAKRQQKAGKFVKQHLLAKPDRRRKQRPSTPSDNALRSKLQRKKTEKIPSGRRTTAIRSSRVAASIAASIRRGGRNTHRAKFRGGATKGVALSPPNTGRKGDISKSKWRNKAPGGGKPRYLRKR